MDWSFKGLTKDLGRFALYIYEQGRDRFYCAEAQRPTLS